jgi:hypothetical protein
MDYLKIYNHVLGKKYALKIEGKNAKGFCPVCEKNALSVEVSTGKGRCFACDENMNTVSFITKYHNYWFQRTTPDELSSLQESRGLKVSALTKAKFAYDGFNDRWLVPYKNPNTAYLSNLGNFRITGDNAFKVFVLPNEGGMFPKGFYNPYSFTFKPKSKNVKLLIGEGEWDSVALIHMLGVLEEEEKELYSLLGCPGAKIIPENTGTLLKHYDNIVLLYDNDEPGQNGIGKMATELISLGKKVQFLNWDGCSQDLNKPLDGYDIRDVVTKCKKGFSFISKHFADLELEVPAKQEEELGPGFIHSVEGVEPVDSLKDYLGLYENEMLLTDTNRKAVIYTMAVAASSAIPGLAVWTFIVGNASGGKTTVIESYGGEHEWCNYASKFKATSLISGMQGSKNSYLQFINHKPFFIKDFTCVLDMNASEQSELFGMLRDLYDGSIKITYGNGKIENFKNINFPIIAGVTFEIQKVKHAHLGERFLRFNYSDEHVSTDHTYEVMDTMLKGFGRQTEKKDNLTKATIGYLKTVKNNYWDVTALPELGASSRRVISDLAIYTANLRTQPQTHRTEGLLYRPKPEDPYRLGLQFTKIAFSAAKVFEPTKPVKATLNLSEDVVGIITKTAMDTCYGFGHDIVRYLHDNPKSAHSDISRYAKVESTRCYRVLTDLKTVGILTTITKTASRGRPTLLYKLTDNFQALTDKMFTDES